MTNKETSLRLKRVKNLSYFAENKEKFPGLDFTGSWYGKNANHYYVLDGSQLVGFIVSDPKEDEEKTSSIGVYIAPEFRGKGYATKAEKLLVNREKLKKLIGVINKKNTASLKMHKKLHFKYDPNTPTLRKKKELNNRQIQYFKKVDMEKKAGILINQLVKLISERKYNELQSRKTKRSV